jgi:hypothetical protein
LDHNIKMNVEKYWNVDSFGWLRITAIVRLF